MTRNELINRAAALGGWTLVQGKIRRYGEKGIECPITAVANAMAKDMGISWACLTVKETVIASQMLGLSNKNRCWAVISADNADGELLYDLTHAKTEG